MPLMFCAVIMNYHRNCRGRWVADVIHEWWGESFKTLKSLGYSTRSLRSADFDKWSNFQHSSDTLIHVTLGSHQSDGAKLALSKLISNWCCYDPISASTSKALWSCKWTNLWDCKCNLRRLTVLIDSIRNSRSGSSWLHSCCSRSPQSSANRIRFCTLDRGFPAVIHLVYIRET